MTGEPFFAPPLDSPAIRESARGESCLIRIPLVCNDSPDTTVFCHGRKYPGGGGASIKPDDLGGAYGCYACHCVVDGHVPLPEWLTREQVVRYFHDGHILTLRRLRTKGLLFAQGPWLPLATAPRDGSTILLMKYHPQMSTCWTAWWAPDGIEHEGDCWVLNDDAENLAGGEETEDHYWAPYFPPEGRP